MSDIRVLIIANDPLARAGLASLIGEQPGFVVVGRVPGDVRLSAELDLYHADAAVWDLGWEWLSDDGSSRTDLTPISEVIETGLPLIVLIPNDELTSSLWGIRVHGILLRDSRPEQIAAALSALLQGLTVLDTSLIDQIATPISQPTLAPVDSLTAREMECCASSLRATPTKQLPKP